MKQILFYVLISFALCSCEPKDDPRCSIYDNECTKNFFQNIAVQYAHTGIPEAGIPIIDPFKLTNVTLNILGLMDLTLVQGEAEGIGKCVVTKFETNVPARYRTPEIMCNKIIIRGNYKLASAAIVENTCSWCGVHGEGYGTIILEDWYFKFRYPFQMVKRADGKIYLDAAFDKAIYKTDVKKVTVAADSIKSGKHDITHHVVSFINHNWKLLMKSNIGKFINDQSAQYYYGIYNTFFNYSPANTYLKDDLTPLLESSDSTGCKSSKKDGEVHEKVDMKALRDEF